MSYAIPLKPRPRVEQYEQLAKDFRLACKSSDAGVVRDWAIQWLEKLARWSKQELTARVHEQIGYEGDRLERGWRQYQKKNQVGCTLSDCRALVARAHGFASWKKFAKHVEALSRKTSVASNFEAAADAIADGDLAKLKKLLRRDPKLTKERSNREHRSTLLHYVSANGIEDFRQRTPKNILEITSLLLAAGADVNAESDAYRGRSTTFGLAATSYHPEKAGVQLELLKLLIDHGALIDGPDGGSAVNGCLHNGRGDAAEFLANHGARLDLEGAAGVGRLDVVKSFFKSNGKLKSGATKQQLADAFAWACEFGRLSVVEFLVEQGFPIASKLKHDGQTGLHWAALEGNAEIVEFLIRRGAPVETRDESYNGTPLEWALYGWVNSAKQDDEGFYKTVALLSRAGSSLDPQWFEGDEERQLSVKRLRSDPRMLAALEGRD